MKRFTNTDKWDDAWFLNLTPSDKLAWMAIWELCDDVGVIKPPEPILAIYLNEESFSLEMLASRVEGRLVQLPNGRWWIPEFVELNYPTGVSSVGWQHEEARESIRKNGLPSSLIKRPVGFTYLMIDSANGLVKIGRSRKPKVREKTLQSEKPSIEMIGYTSAVDELDLHRRFASARVRGEWFRLDRHEMDDLLASYEWTLSGGEL